MNRATSAVARKARRKKLLSYTKGFYGRRKSCYKLAVKARMRQLEHSKRGLRLKKRVQRSKWIKEISIWGRLNSAPGKRVNYSNTIGALKEKYGNLKAVHLKIRELVKEKGDERAVGLLS